MEQSPNTNSYEFLEMLNHTELYQMCRRAGIQVHPRASRTEMMDYLLANTEPPPTEHEIDSWRNGIMAFLMDHWEVVSPQITCPAKSKDPRACYQCTDVQVINCVVQNPSNEHLIQLRRS